MAKLRRYTASPQGAQVAGVRASGMPAQGSIAPALNKAGRTVSHAADLKFKADYHRAAMDDEIQLATAQQKFEEAALFETDVIARTDYAQDEPVSQNDADYFKTLTTFDMSNRDKVAGESIKSFNNKVGQLKFGFKTKAAQAKFEAWKIKNLGAFHNGIKHAVNSKYVDYQTAKFDRLISDAIANGNGEEATRFVNVMAENELITEVEANKRRDNVQANLQKQAKEQGEAAINSIKPMIEDTLKSSDTWQNEKRFSKDDKRAAYDMVDKQVNQLVEAEIISKDEAFDAKVSLNNDVDNYAEEFKKQEKVAKENKTLAIYSDFVPKLARGELTADDVFNSELDKKTKDSWQPILQGSYQDPPEKIEWDGYKKATESVLQYSAGAIDKKTAIEDIMTDRYVDRTLTDKDFQSALKRIESPYPRYFAKQLENTLKQVEETTASFWKHKSVDRKNIMEVNTNLMDWVDSQIEQGKHPTPKEMYSMASQFRSGQDSVHEVGQVIERGGLTLEVIGFDTDGEPLVEFVK